MPYKKITPIQSVSVNDLVGKPSIGRPVREVTVPASVEQPAPVAEESNLPSQGSSFRRRIHISSSENGEGVSQMSHQNDQGGFDMQGNGNGYASGQSSPTEVVKGFLDIPPYGHGFLRP